MRLESPNEPTCPGMEIGLESYASKSATVVATKSMPGSIDSLLSGEYVSTCPVLEVYLCSYFDPEAPLIPTYDGFPLAIERYKQTRPGLKVVTRDQSFTPLIWGIMLNAPVRCGFKAVVNEQMQLEAAMREPWDGMGAYHDSVYSPNPEEKSAATIFERREL